MRWSLCLFQADRQAKLAELRKMLGEPEIQISFRKKVEVIELVKAPIKKISNDRRIRELLAELFGDRIYLETILNEAGQFNSSLISFVQALLHAWVTHKQWTLAGTLQKLRPAYSGRRGFSSVDVNATVYTLLIVYWNSVTPQRPSDLAIQNHNQA